MNKVKYFQQGGAAPQQDIQAQVTALVQAAMQGDQKATQTVNQILEAAKSGDQKAVQLAQMIQQVAKQMQGQAVSAKYGSKLAYLQSLKCGGKTKKAKKAAVGTKVCPECDSKLVSKAQSGAVAGAGFYRNWSPDDIKKLQSFLASADADLGDASYQGEIDGKIGAKTIAAVKAYQNKHQLKADGMWGASTNSMQGALGWDTMQKAQYKDNWKGEAGDLRNKSNFTYANADSMSQKQLDELVTYYTMNPELLYSDDAEHARNRQIFHNSGKWGSDFLNQAAASLTKEERAKIDPKKLTTQYKQDEFVSNVNKGSTEAAKRMLPAMIAPVAASTLIAPMVGGAGLATSAGLAGSVLGGKALGNVGESIARKLGEKHKLDPYSDPVADRYRVPSVVLDPERRINEYGQVGKNLGTITGSLAGGALASTAATGTQAAVYNTMGQGRANLGYPSKFTRPATPSTNFFGTTTPAPLEQVSNWQLYKAGLGPATYQKGLTRLGGPQGVKFSYNGVKYHPGATASQQTIGAATSYYNNPKSTLSVGFGGDYGTGRGVKIGDAYRVNTPIASGLGVQASVSEIPVSKIAEDYQMATPPLFSRIRNNAQERRQERQQRRANQNSENE